jgi:uncharacterized RDD family membrane protein YckC
MSEPEKLNHGRKTLRLINFLLDTTIYVAIMIILVILLKSQIPQEKLKWFSLLFYLLYYFLFELLIKQTPGKLITRSKVITTSQSNEYFLLQILLRTLLRFIPLDILSYLFNYRGLHDWMTKTTIIKL